MKFHITKLSDDEIAFLESLNDEYPGHIFSVTPLIYNPESDEVRRGMMVRLPNGELRRLRHSWNREQIQGAEVISNPAIAETFETAVMNETRSAIRKEMKRII